MRTLSFSSWAFCLVLLLASSYSKSSSHGTAGGNLQIDKAVCGANDSWQDITRYLRSRVQGDSLSVTIDQPFNEIGGDPAFGQSKHLIVDYHFKGKSYQLVLEEGSPAFTVELPSPEASPPQQNPFASVMAERFAKVPLPVSSMVSHLLDNGLTYLAVAASFVAIAVSVLSLIQVRQLKKEFHKAEDAVVEG